MAASSHIPDAFHMIRPPQLIALIVFGEEYKSRVPLWGIFSFLLLLPTEVKIQ